jgi:hypothetical protein
LSASMPLGGGAFSDQGRTRRLSDRQRSFLRPISSSRRIADALSWRPRARAQASIVLISSVSKPIATRILVFPSAVPAFAFHFPPSCPLEPATLVSSSARHRHGPMFCGSGWCCLGVGSEPDGLAAVMRSDLVAPRPPVLQKAKGPGRDPRPLNFRAICSTGLSGRPPCYASAWAGLEHWSPKSKIIRAGGPYQILVVSIPKSADGGLRVGLICK